MKYMLFLKDTYSFLSQFKVKSLKFKVTLGRTLRLSENVLLTAYCVLEA
jgi:hypothetical protein